MPGEGARTPKRETRTTAVSKSSSTQAGEHLLLADHRDRNRLLRRSSAERRSYGAEKQKEDLEAPAVDIYGDDSWGSHVNPFAGMAVNIPDRQDIDLRSSVMPIQTRQITSHYGYRRSFGRMHYG